MSGDGGMRFDAAGRYAGVIDQTLGLYLREFREDIPELEKILVPSSTMAQVPLAQVVTIKSVLGPQEIKGERGLLVGYVTMNTRDRDEISVVEDAEKLLQAALKDGRLKLPAGYYWEWSGQFESQKRATTRMQILVPVTLFIMIVMLYLGFKRWWIAPIIYFVILVSAAGGFTCGCNPGYAGNGFTCADIVPAVARPNCTP